ncbi:50S ribosomal protein L37ae [Candidatus Micrarchaeota archaeon]|nr:50S ribosomal protein L37ae [Candidatus Micrarchaeota archaeon]
MQTARFGASIRKLHDSAIKDKKKSYECPKCGKIKVVRKGNALWMCKGCKSTFAGGAYSFTTEAGELSRRLAADYAKSS